MKDMMSLADSVLPAPDLGPENGCRDVRFPAKKQEGQTVKASLGGKPIKLLLHHVFASGGKTAPTF